MAAPFNKTIRQGNRVSYTWTWIDSNGNHIDASTWPWLAQIKRETSDGTAVAELETADVSVVDGGDGLGTLSKVIFTWDETATLIPARVYQWSYKTKINGTIPYTFRKGEVTIEAVPTTGVPS